ncbi:MAG TPA: hypothetical protein VFA12_15345 [Stellaceae bacterium]|nr:hypothetical protein [Stellaceae bacterium]
MFGKVGLAALAVVPVFGAAHTGDLRELYNQMYPVNALTRDAFNLCHESDATFVRALAVDRDRCLDGMPHSLAVAIGRTRPDGDLLAFAPISEGERAAIRLAQANFPALRQPVEAPRPTAISLAPLHVAAALAGKPLGEAMDRIGGSGPPIGDAELAQLVLGRDAAAEPAASALPLLPAGAAARPVGEPPAAKDAGGA